MLTLFPVHAYMFIESLHIEYSDADTNSQEEEQKETKRNTE